jgi:hypothetical protein
VATGAAQVIRCAGTGTLLRTEVLLGSLLDLAQELLALGKECLGVGYGSIKTAESAIRHSPEAFIIIFGGNN